MTLLIPRKRLARLPRGLTAYWPLDATACEFGSGQVRPLDLIGNNYGVDAKSPGMGGGPPFDGDGVNFNLNATTSTYLTLNADPLLGAGAGNQTLMGWFYLRSYLSSDGSALTDRIWAFKSDIVVQVGDGSFPAGEVSVDINSNAAGVTTTSAALMLNTWTHLAVTISGTTILVYINGASVAISNTGQLPGLSTFWAIGSRSPTERIMNGKIAHHMVCQGTVLTAGEIADLYNSFFVAEEVMPALFTPAVGSSFLAAWARGSNLPVIGTGNY